MLLGDDLVFFYYDIGLDNLQEWRKEYDWNSVVAEFAGVLDIESCATDHIPTDF